MTFSFILLGVIFICVSFGVFEKIWKYTNIKRPVLMMLLLLTICLYYVPNVIINGISFSFAGFLLPVIFSVIILLKTRKIKILTKMFLSSMLVFVLNIVYCLISFSTYESAILQPYLVFGLILGIVPFLLNSTPKRIFASNFIGLILSDLVFYFSRFALSPDYTLIIGSEKIIAIMLTSFVVSLFVYYLLRKIKAFSIYRKLKKSEAKN